MPFRHCTLQALLCAIAVTTATGCVPVRYDAAALTDPTRIQSSPQTAAHFERVGELRNMLRALGPAVDPAEADLVAQTALALPLELAGDYGLTSPPIVHNILVNTGLRPRGLCTHWAEDMLRRLHALELKTLDLYWAVAFPTRPFRLEHSSALVTARGRPFEEGIVLDAWRYSGELFFAPVSDDQRYQWQRLYNTITDPPPPERAQPVPPESLYD